MTKRQEFPAKIKDVAYTRANGKCDKGKPKMLICSCHNCGRSFQRNRMNATRAAKPQYCSPQCFAEALENRARQRFQARLLENVAIAGADECWLWTGRVHPRGYGRFDIKLPGELRAYPRIAHRIVYSVLVGDVPDGKIVCHRCDNPPCCNPAHHFIGTPKENFDDMVRKGRKPPLQIRRGEAVNTSKLTEIEAREILRSEKSVSDLASKYGITTTSVYMIKRGRNWAHLSAREP